MCLTVPCQIIELLPDRGAVVRSGQRDFTVSLITIDDAPNPGDWLLVHSGFALQVLGAQEVIEALRRAASTTEGMQ